MTPAERDGPPCAASCGWPMDAGAYAAGLRYHPTCAPDDLTTAGSDGEGT